MDWISRGSYQSCHLSSSYHLSLRRPGAFVGGVPLTSKKNQADKVSTALDSLNEAFRKSKKQIKEFIGHLRDIFEDEEDDEEEDDDEDDES
jgi:hypothetical protein